MELNRTHIQKFGPGWQATSENLKSPDSLDHVLNEIRGSLFGKDLYPTILEKAAILSWRIITGHIFYDGNKRTGMATCEIFLALNGYHMEINNEVVEVAIKAAEHKISYEEYLQWLKVRTNFSLLSRFIIGLRLKYYIFKGYLIKPEKGKPITV